MTNDIQAKGAFTGKLGANEKKSSTLDKMLTKVSSEIFPPEATPNRAEDVGSNEGKLSNLESKVTNEISTYRTDTERAADSRHQVRIEENNNIKKNSAKVAGTSVQLSNRDKYLIRDLKNKLTQVDADLGYREMILYAYDKFMNMPLNEVAAIVREYSKKEFE